MLAGQLVAVQLLVDRLAGQSAVDVVAQLLAERSHLAVEGHVGHSEIVGRTRLSAVRDAFDLDECGPADADQRSIVRQLGGVVRLDQSETIHCALPLGSQRAQARQKARPVIAGRSQSTAEHSVSGQAAVTLWLTLW